MQASRNSTSLRVSALLSSIGGKTTLNHAKPSPNPSSSSSKDETSEIEKNAQELRDYDRKVYAGLVAMTADFDRQLKALNVPFYAIRHDLVVLEEGKEKVGPSVKVGRIDRGELRELQRRVLELLEDLFGD